MRGIPSFNLYVPGVVERIAGYKPEDIRQAFVNSQDYIDRNFLNRQIVEPLLGRSEGLKKPFLVDISFLRKSVLVIENEPMIGDEVLVGPVKSGVYASGIYTRNINTDIESTLEGLKNPDFDYKEDQTASKLVYEVGNSVAFIFFKAAFNQVDNSVSDLEIVTNRKLHERVMDTSSAGVNFFPHEDFDWFISAKSYIYPTHPEPTDPDRPSAPQFIIKSPAILQEYVEAKATGTDS